MVINREVTWAAQLTLICRWLEGSFHTSEGWNLSRMSMVLSQLMRTIQRCMWGKHSPFHFKVIYNDWKSTTWKGSKVCIPLWENINIWLFFLEEIKDEKNLISVFIMGLITLEPPPVLLAYLAIHIYESSKSKWASNYEWFWKTKIGLWSICSPYILMSTVWNFLVWSIVICKNDLGSIKCFVFND